MNILFIGGLCPPERVEFIRKISPYFDYPGQVLQSALLEGFDAISDVTVISSFKIITTRFHISEYRYRHNTSSQYEDVMLSFWNFPYFRNLFDGIRKYREVMKQGIKPDIIFVYGMSIYNLQTAALIKKINQDSVVISMIADLPQFMRMNGNIVYTILKNYENSQCVKYMNECVDGFILLSDCMKEKLPIANKSYIVVEGIFHSENTFCSSVLKAKEKVIMYSGNLSKRYGLLDLLDAFSMIKDPAYRLWLCGPGDTVEKIKDACTKDSRVQYLGIIPRNKVLELQKQATLLVNPRHSNEDFTRYSFPSKTMEYMASGTPTLMCPLLSLPAEYKNHLFLVNDESVQGLSRAIYDICEKPKDELYSFGNMAADFILANKTAEKQCKRIVDLAQTISNKKK